MGNKRVDANLQRAQQKFPGHRKLFYQSENKTKMDGLWVNELQIGGNGAEGC
jgi:hypothetical protein